MSFEAAATDTNPATEEKSPKIVISISKAQHKELQQLRSKLLDAGLSDTIESTASVAARVFVHGLTVAKQEVKDAKAAAKAKTA